MSPRGGGGGSGGGRGDETGSRGKGVGSLIIGCLTLKIGPLVCWYRYFIMLVSILSVHPLVLKSRSKRHPLICNSNSILPLNDFNNRVYGS